MTTRTTTITTSTKGMWVYIGASAAGLAMLGGVLIWQARPAGDAAAPVATTRIGTYVEGMTPLGGLAEQYRQAQQAQAEREAARVTATGGMAELYAAHEADRVAAEAARWSSLDGDDAPCGTTITLALC